jgi:hypothetical protein
MAINKSKKMSRSQEMGAGKWGAGEVGRINKNNLLTPNS